MLKCSSLAMTIGFTYTNNKKGDHAQNYPSIAVGRHFKNCDRDGKLCFDDRELG